MLVCSLHAQRSRNCQQARAARATGGAVCPVGDQVQEHNHDLERRGEFLGRQPTGSAYCQFGLRRILEAIGPDEQEAINGLPVAMERKLALRKSAALRECHWDDATRPSELILEPQVAANQHIRVFLMKVRRNLFPNLGPWGALATQ